jgi:O-antigen/teichoic acid export membrane protein
VSRYVLTTVSGLVFLMLLFKDPVILFALGEKYATCANVVTLMLPGILAQSLTLLFIADLLGKGQLGLVMCSGVLCFVTMVGSDLFWIPRWGIYGAACASTFAYIAQCVYLLRIHSSAHDEQVSRYLRLSRAEVAAILAGINRRFKGA